MDLFEYSMERQLKKDAPLAERMRPSTLEEFVGQEHVLGDGKFLRRSIVGDRLASMIFYGPPGTGKTSLAMIIANTTKMKFEKLSAVTSGVKDIRKVTENAEEELKLYGNRTILFIDEIHRFNKSQQDALLPFVERGILVLIGATTENPYFEVNKALLSRSVVIRLESLTRDDLKVLINKALTDKEKGLGNYFLKVSEDAIECLITVGDGDARIVLNALELAVLTTPKSEDGVIYIDSDIIKDCIQTKGIKYDSSGDEHYDTVSAFIKSMRGSDPDATLYWLAKMIEGGEDLKFIARRIIICASEDVGNADPQALTIAVSAFKAIDIIGMPEGRIPLAQAAVYVACAPKSNASYVGINSALEDIRNNEIGDIPKYLKDASYKGAKKFGHGIGYKYPHDYPNSYVKQQYLPDEYIGKKYYNPTSNGYEKIISERLKELFDKKD
ncbi:replication-associated recombination protein A [Anaerosalibacter sp. Marseille-P3206]|uniref:replication-associated recombination protein A n=1 Tax=Anaerosalibacter sp. Marseille-P3206 TaxID=1871005 RepID=UPI0009856BD2|nr:replication-associated recombination protein A [Anaerosalibacter sp. Marseille-P3206]